MRVHQEQQPRLGGVPDLGFHQLQLWLDGKPGSSVSTDRTIPCLDPRTLHRADMSTQVLSAYCDPGATYSFPTPTAVSIYITDVPEVDGLAPCAKSALREAVQ